MPMWIDAHCHLQLGVEEGAIERAQAAGVTQMVCVGTNLDTSKEALTIADRNLSTVFAAIGLHPHDSSDGVGSVIALADEYIANSGKALVAIGETGLDYFYDYSPREIQREVFAAQIELAKKLDLALVIHTRDAWDDTFAILRSVGVPPRTVIHCFTGSPKEAEIALELGLYLSFSGIVTFKKAEELQAAARFCPVDRMTIETDSPFLTPVPLRGRPNEPANIALVGKFVSELKKLPLEEFESLVFGNTQNFFNLERLKNWT